MSISFGLYDDFGHHLGYDGDSPIVSDHYAMCAVGLLRRHGSVRFACISDGGSSHIHLYRDAGDVVMRSHGQNRFRSQAWVGAWHHLDQCMHSDRPYDAICSTYPYLWIVDRFEWMSHMQCGSVGPYGRGSVLPPLAWRPTGDLVSRVDYAIIDPEREAFIEWIIARLAEGHGG